MTEIVVHAEHQDREAGKLGMWIFLFTEMFLFGGLFLVYAVLRAGYSANFHEAANELNAFIGTLNTVVLLISSMSVAMSITAIQKNNTKLAMLLIFITLVLATLFLVNKYFEWRHEFEYGVYPGSEVLKNMKKANCFFLVCIL